MRRRILKSTLLGIVLTLLVVSLGYAAPPPPASLIKISTTANEEMLPAVAYSTTSDTYLVAYEDNSHIMLRLYNSTGSPAFSTPFDLTNDGFWPSLAYNSLHDQFGLAFVFNHQDIVICWLNADNQVPVACDTIYAQSTEAVMSTAIAFNSNNANDDFMIVWQQGTLGDWSIYGHRATPTNPYNLIGSRIEIAKTTLTPTFSENYSAPDIAYNLNMNEYLVVFEHDTNDPSHINGSDILGRRIHNDGTPGPAPLPYLSIDVSDANQTHPTIAAYRLNATNPYFVAYEDDWADTVPSIRGIYLEQDGSLPNPAYYVNVSATYQVREANPDISVSESLGSYVVTWAKYSGSNMDIYARYVDVNLITSITSPPTLISGTAQNARNDETYPVVAAGTTGAMIAWQEDGWGTGTSDIIGSIWGNVSYLPLILE